MIFESINTYLENADIFSLPMLAILTFVGFIVGFVNTVAGSATAITYMLFMAMGMPVSVANATSRVGVLLQFTTSTIIFKKKGFIDFREAFKVGIPVMFGSIFGAEFAALIDQHIFEIILSVFLVVMIFFMFYDAKMFINGQPEKRRGQFTAVKWIVFFIIGFYGGFTHIGVGILLIFASVMLVGMNIVEANAVKQFAVMLYTPVALTVFAIHGQVNWEVGLIYSAGNVLGAIAGTKITVRFGGNFIRWCVAVIIIIFIGQLILKNM
ncbi:MAG: sulfite exporter TauE/SafE family protein [Prevotellaceae bacterium]|jgi:uncharacterized membrane protein YfcA|nr:sulfite exporter TauE/SafE family protein [Prevotellaceae bacterium]